MVDIRASLLDGIRSQFRRFRFFTLGLLVAVDRHFIFVSFTISWDCNQGRGVRMGQSSL